LLDFTKKPKFSYLPVQQQEGGDDCGVFSIAFATALLHKQDLVLYCIVLKLYSCKTQLQEDKYT